MGRVTYREHLPRPELRRFVDRFWTRTGGEDGGPRRVLPDGCIDVLVRLDDVSRPIVVGAMTRPLVIAPGAAARIVAVRFRPGGAVPFLGLPAHELTDRNVDQSALAPSRRLHLDEKLDPLSALERALLARLHRVPDLDPVVLAATRALSREDPPSVAVLARHIGWSRQHLRRVFRTHVGVGPMTFTRVARLHRAIRRLQQGRGESLAEAAATLGYFDEAHMARDFRELAGVTPGAARERRGSIFPIPALLDESLSVA